MKTTFLLLLVKYYQLSMAIKVSTHTNFLRLHKYECLHTTCDADVPTYVHTNPTKST